MKLYNTLTRKVETFRPGHDPVRIYVCGVTPYDTTHLGHAFTYVFFDTLIRYLKWQGHQARYVQNITDVDDDILRRAAELGISYTELGDRYVREFQANMEQLNVVPPDVQPRATEEIPKIVDMVRELLNDGVAYRHGGNAYYRIAAAPEYGRLSALDRQNMLELARQRGGHPDDPRKEDPLDFVLWQASVPGEPSWESPWGNGRPGWHIECSAMALKYLGEQLDIHGGGRDLVFPHHENEIVQSQEFTRTSPFVRFWAHTGMVGLQGRPMSKSLGNMVFVSDLVQQHSPQAVRLTLLNHHYRGDWEYDVEEVAASENQFRRIGEAMSASSRPGHDDRAVDSAESLARFTEVMDDDLNTPSALDVISALAERILQGAADGLDIREAQRVLSDLCGVVGLDVNKNP